MTTAWITDAVAALVLTGMGPTWNRWRTRARDADDLEAANRREDNPR